MERGSEQVECTFAFAEFRVSAFGLEYGFGIQRVFRVH